jgi:hypothetical protein
MPYSYVHYKKDVLQHFLTNIKADCRILDVGPGAGTYGKLLAPYYNSIDAVEIWPPYVEKFSLREIYKTVHLGSVLDFDFSGYDYLILGDVLEHLAPQEAKSLISSISKAKQKCLVAVPYQYEQGSYHGNPYEEHLQADLDKKTVLKRFPELVYLFGDKEYGHFVNYPYKRPPLHTQAESMVRHTIRRIMYHIRAIKNRRKKS